MPDFTLNDRCIVGMPACGYGFASSRSCFLARPSDESFALEENVIEQVLRDRNYRLDVALSMIDPGKFAFCTKICSRIIQSHFCIVLLNQSRHRDSPEIRVPNPNVHLEYGMMLSFRKHVIPMQPEDEVLAFNIYPLDTIKYTPGSFKDRLEHAVDDAILRFETRQPPSGPVGVGLDLLKYLNFRGLQFADVQREPARSLFQIGSSLSFNLFFDREGYMFFGIFPEEDPKEIVIRSTLLLRNLQSTDASISSANNAQQRAEADRILAGLRLTLLVPDTAPVQTILTRINEFQTEALHLPITAVRPEEVSAFVKSLYESVQLEGA
jgi:hypothetical protein